MALEKEREGGGESGRHIAACLIELYFLLLEQTDGELSLAARPRPASAGLPSPLLPAQEIKNRCVRQALNEKAGVRGRFVICSKLLLGLTHN